MRPDDGDACREHSGGWYRPVDDTVRYRRIVWQCQQSNFHLFGCRRINLHPALDHLKRSLYGILRRNERHVQSGSDHSQCGTGSDGFIDLWSDDGDACGQYACSGDGILECGVRYGRIVWQCRQSDLDLYGYRRDSVCITVDDQQ